MALITPRDLYTGGAVTFNSSPYVNFAANLMAKKQAKDEALDQYYQNLNKSINPAGVRTQDVPGFMEKTNALQNYWQQNKDAIKNPRLDGGRSQTEYNSRYQDIQGYINQSKNEELRKKPFIDILADPDKRERITDKMLYDVHLHDLPLTDPSRKSFDITQEDFNPKLLSPEEFQKFNEGIGKGVNVDKNEIVTTPDPNDRFSNIVTTSARYSPEKLAAIGNEAKDAYTTNRRVSYTFEQSHPFKEWKQEHEPQFNKLNEIHRQVYGTDITDNEDLYAASILQKKLEPVVTATKEDAFGRREAYKSSLAEGRESRLIDKRKAAGAYNYGNGVGQNGSGNALDAMPDVVKENYFIQGGTWYNKNGSPVDTGGGQTFISKQEIPATWLSTLKSGGLPIDKIRDGVYATIKDGKIQSIYNKQIGTVTRQQMEGVYQKKMDTEPLKGTPLQFGQNGQKKTWKHSATGAGGKKAFSDDGINWFDENGNPIK